MQPFWIYEAISSKKLKLNNLVKDQVLRDWFQYPINNLFAAVATRIIIDNFK